MVCNVCIFGYLESFVVVHTILFFRELFGEDIKLFLNDAKGSRIADNIKLSEDNLTSNTAILASRFVLQSGTVGTPEDWFGVPL